MKTILMLILALNFTQKNFSVDYAGELMWQHIYKTDMTSSELHKSLYLSPRLTDIIKVDDTFYIATLKKTKVEYEKLGFKRMQLPIYISNNDIGSATVVIQYKEGKYKVTIKDIKLQSNTSYDYGSLSKLAVTDGQLNETFMEYGEHIYHYMFLTWLELEKVSDNW